MIIARWIDRRTKTEIIIYGVDSKAAEEVLLGYEAEGWNINKKYCIDEVNGRLVRHYMMVRSVAKRNQKKSKARSVIMSVMKWAASIQNNMQKK